MTQLTLEEKLKSMTGPAAPELIETGEGGKVRCFACGHRCLVAPGRSGVCRVRFNEDGVLKVPKGYIGALQCDPIEKKPFFHAMPGTDALSFGMLGCDFHCGYCQNWITSQALRDPEAVAPTRPISASQLVHMAKVQGASTVASTYNEPLITSEWAAEVFSLAKPAGFKCAYISNGNATPQVLDYLKPLIDMYKVDLKSFNDQNYRRLGGVLKHVMETIVMLKERNIWCEVVTLLVPGFNYNTSEIREMARFLVSVSPDIPWHVTAFHDDYKMKDKGNTDSSMLLTAANIGREEGLRYVYAGNLPGKVGDFENTRCPDCQEVLIERRGYYILQDRLTGVGKCFKCDAVIPGVWS